jgi:hypothetical protein
MEAKHHERILAMIAREEPRLRAIDAGQTASRPGPGKWCRREILGHLIDSASNNHQRFVRAQLEGRLSFPGYEQDGWVRTQAYDCEPWEELVTLWAAANRHLAHVAAVIPETARAIPVNIGGRAEVTLDWLVGDYLRHQEHHLASI